MQDACNERRGSKPQSVSGVKAKKGRICEEQSQCSMLEHMINQDENFLFTEMRLNSSSDSRYRTVLLSEVEKQQMLEEKKIQERHRIFIDSLHSTPPIDIMRQLLKWHSLLQDDEIRDVVSGIHLERNIVSAEDVQSFSATWERLRDIFIDYMFPEENTDSPEEDLTAEEVWTYTTILEDLWGYLTLIGAKTAQYRTASGVKRIQEEHDAQHTSFGFSEQDLLRILELPLDSSQELVQKTYAEKSKMIAALLGSQYDRDVRDTLAYLRSSYLAYVNKHKPNSVLPTEEWAMIAAHTNERVYGILFLDNFRDVLRFAQSSFLGWIDRETLSAGETVDEQREDDEEREKVRELAEAMQFIQKECSTLDAFLDAHHIHSDTEAIREELGRVQKVIQQYIVYSEVMRHFPLLQKQLLVLGHYYWIEMWLSYAEDDLIPRWIADQIGVTPDTKRKEAEKAFTRWKCKRNMDLLQRLELLDPVYVSIVIGPIVTVEMLRDIVEGCLEDPIKKDTTEYDWRMAVLSRISDENLLKSIENVCVV